MFLAISTKAGVHCLLPHAGNTSPAGTATEAAVVGAFRRSGSLHSTMIVITEVYRCAVGKLSRCCELLSSLQLELPIFFRFVINAMRTGMDISAAGRHWQLFRVQAARFFTDDSSLVWSTHRRRLGSEPPSRMKLWPWCGSAFETLFICTHLPCLV